MSTITPGDIVLVVHLQHAGIIAIFALGHLRIALEVYGGIADGPVNAVFGEAGENIHADRTGVAAEDAGKTVFKGNHSRVENAVCVLLVVTVDNGVFGIPPNRCVQILGLVLPGDVGERVADNFCHYDFSFQSFLFTASDLCSRISEGVILK